MTNQQQVVIAGAGGIGKAVAVLLAQYSDTPPRMVIANRTLDKAEQVARNIKLGAGQSVHVSAVPLDFDQPSEEWLAVLQRSDLLIDCLPGRYAPQLAGLARAHGLHYANLTEHVRETAEIEKLAQNADTGFVLQSGLAPGFVNVLANGLFQHFCQRNGVDKADRLAMKVGALTRNVTAPHFYAFTWSPAGVANEYLRPVRCLREYEPVSLPALSERELIYVNGTPFEADLTSGGAADLPEALAGKVRCLDYKTLRYPGHFDWVEQQLKEAPDDANPVDYLQEKMENDIPRQRVDKVVIHAYVEGRDRQGKLKRMERDYHLVPQPVGRNRLGAVEAATAAAMAEVAAMLLRGELKGVVRQSQIDADTFLGGPFVTAVFGRWTGGEDVLSSPKYQVK